MESQKTVTKITMDDNITPKKLEEFINYLAVMHKWPRIDWGGAPKQTYIIAAAGRDGSSLLSDLLYQTEVAGAPVEFLHTNDKGLYKRARNCSDFSMDKYIELIIANTTTPNGVFGDKDFYYRHLFFNFPFDKYNPKYIYLSRRDKIRQGISLYKARMSGKWNSLGITSRELTEDDFSYEQISRRISWVTAQDAAWLQFFKQRNITPCHVIYEEFIEDMGGTVSRVLKETLNIDFPSEKVPASILEKQSDELSEYFYKRMIKKH